MVRVFVRDKDRGERVRLFTNILDALESLPAGDAGVYQDACLRAGHNGAVPIASTGQHRDGCSHIAQLTRKTLWKGSNYLAKSVPWCVIMIETTFISYSESASPDDESALC